MDSYKFDPLNYRFDMPQSERGLIVRRSYAYDVENCVIIERIEDGSDRTERFLAYKDPGTEDDWDPWNQAPDLGECLGECEIEDDSFEEEDYQ